MRMGNLCKYEWRNLGPTSVIARGHRFGIKKKIDMIEEVGSHAQAWAFKGSNYHQSSLGKHDESRPVWAQFKNHCALHIAHLSRPIAPFFLTLHRPTLSSTRVKRVTRTATNLLQCKMRPPRCGAVPLWKQVPWGQIVKESEIVICIF